MFQNVFQTENLEIENFFTSQIFFFGLSYFSAKRLKIVKTDRVKKIWSKKFLVRAPDSTNGGGGGAAGRGG